MVRTLTLAMIAGLALSAFSIQPAAAQARSQPGADAPRALAGRAGQIDIRRITLYRSGVGSFERRGQIDGDAAVQLRFKTDQINDILKSMVVLDLSGGAIEGVSYASKEPLARRLSSFGVDISDNPSLAELLGKLRGAVASLTTADGAVSGTILGVESRDQIQGNHDKPIKVAYINLVTGGGIRSFDLTRVTNIELQDKDLAAELNKALTALAEHRADRTKTVEIAFRGQGGRNIAVSYIHEMPVWKASYRLVLPDEKKAAAPAPGKSPSSLSLQGWAIVENPTDEDWNNVTLSLVSGRPVSFQMDLYEPLFVTRPQVPVPTVPGVMPRAYAGGQTPFPSEAREEAAKMEAMGRRLATPASAPAPGRARGGAGVADAAGSPRDGFAELALEPDAMLNYAAAARAQAVESGEVFQYELSSPVTIERQRSAMLPIITEGVSGRRVSIFSRADGSEHPMRGVEITNSTKLQFLPGPIAVYDGAAYAGDAQIGHVAPGEKRLLAYAVDLDMSTITKDESTQAVRKLRIVNGLIEQTNLAVNSITYQFANKSESTSRTVIVEHPKLGGYKLVGPAKPSEETQALYRFEVEVAPGKQASLTVPQEVTYSQSLQVTNFDLPTMLAYQTQGKASKAVVDAFREAQRRQGLINEQQRRVQELERQRELIDKEQARIRENLRAVGDRSQDLFKTWVDKLKQQETQVESLNTDVTKAREEITKLQNDYNTWLAALNVE
ncbi:MAG: hypothetical protein HRU70_02265 [Phycisphaeraceae bacterium]|nr:MAG: hypothetical protein HRU70_02265 [Phycisphaeraceae bacterium]